MVKDNNESEAYLVFRSMLENAITAGADTITLERVTEGLEVCYESGNFGIGEILDDPEIESEIIGIIIDLADLERKPRGTMQIEVLGETRTISVKEYDSFGESAFRLVLRRPVRS